MSAQHTTGFGFGITVHNKTEIGEVSKIFVELRNSCHGTEKVICELPYNNEEDMANAKLICDAFNTANSLKS